MAKKRSYHFVIVEDDHAMAGLMAKLLIKSGHTVQHIDSGNEASTLIQATKPLPRYHLLNLIVSCLI